MAQNLNARKIIILVEIGRGFREDCESGITAFYLTLNLGT